MKEILITSSVLIAVLAAVRRLFRGRISRRLQYALWLLVLARLLLPVSLPQASFSVLSGAEALSARMETAAADVPVPAAASPAAPAFAEAPAAVSSSPSPAPAAAPVRSVGVDAAAVLRFVWLAGMTAALLWFLGSNLLLHRWLRQSRTPLAVPDCPLPVYVTGAVVSPCLFGLLRPAVYLTPKAAADPAGLRHVLTHELCHYRHGDHVWSLLRCLCLAVYWFDPLVWLAAALSRADSELACDEAAIRCLGDEHRLDYGRTLVDMVAVRQPASGLLCAATTMVSGKRGLKARLQMIVKNPKTVLAAAVAAVCIAAVTAGCTFTAAPTDAPQAGEAAAGTLHYVEVQQQNRDAWQYRYELEEDRLRGVRLWAEVWTDGQMEVFEEPAALEAGHFLEVGLSDAEAEDGSRTLRLYLCGNGSDQGAMSTVYDCEFPAGDFPARGASWLGGGSDETPYPITPDVPVVLAFAAWQPAEQDELRTFSCSYLSEAPERLKDYAFAVVFKAEFTADDADDADLPVPEDLPAAPAEDPQAAAASDAAYTATLIQNGEATPLEGVDRDLLEDVIFNSLVRSAAWPNDQPVDGYPFAVCIREDLDGEVHDYYACRRPDGRAILMGTSMYTGLSEDLMQQLEAAAGLSPGGVYDVDAAISRAIRTVYLNEQLADGQCGTDAHVTLALEDEADGGVTACVYGMYLAFSEKDGRLVQDGVGGSLAMAFTFSRDGNGAYRLEDTWEPRDGSYYAPDVRAKFPADAAEAALNAQSMGLLLNQTCYAQAVAGLGIDTRACAAGLVDDICRGGSDGDACVRAHDVEFRELTFYGQDAVDYALDELEAGTDGVRGRVLWRLLHAVFPGEIELFDSPAGTPQEEFTEWRDYVVRIGTANPGWYDGNYTASCVLEHHAHNTPPADLVLDADDSPADGVPDADMPAAEAAPYVGYHHPEPEGHHSAHH